jgi:hypothetical protein
MAGTALLTINKNELRAYAIVTEVKQLSRGGSEGEASGKLVLPPLPMF